MAKRAPDADDDTPPKAKRSRKKRGGAVAVKARARRARRAAPRSNPAEGAWGIMGDLKAVGAGLGAYGGTRLLQRLVTRFVATKKPAWTKHVHAASGALAFAAALVAVRKVKQIAAYEGAVVLGTGLAAAQGLVSAYVPKFAWLMNDAAGALPASAAPVPNALPQASAGMDYLEHELQQMEAQQSLPRAQRAPVQQALRTASAAAGDDLGLEESLVEELGDEAIDDLYGGVFSNPTLLAS